jgi:hypothetical protein
MEFILKKDGSGNTTISDKELIKLFKLVSIDKRLKTAEAKLAKLEKAPEVSKETILNMINMDFLKSGEVLNISAAPSIEKDKKIKPGSIYYNPSKGVRLKTKEGWITLKFD